MKYSLLIIEDEPLAQQALRGYVEQHFPVISTIFTARNSSNALEIAYRERPDIYLVDINIPGKSGLEIIEDLTQNHVNGYFVITTAYDTFEYAKRAITLGCNDFLLKPVQDDELDLALNKCFAEIKEQRFLAEIRQQSDSAVFQALRQSKNVSHMMTQMYGWPQDGSLSALSLCWLLPIVEDEEERDAAHAYLRSMLAADYNVISFAEQRKIWTFVHSKMKADPPLMHLKLWIICNAALQRHNGCIHISKELQNYDALPEVFSHKHAMKKLALPKDIPYFDIACLGSDVVHWIVPRRAIVRQRLVQRLREKGFSRIAAMLDRLSLQYGVLPTLHIFLEALMSYGYRADELTEAIVSWDHTAFTALLEHIRRATVSDNGELVNAIDIALMLMSERCGAPLLQVEIAEEVGLSSAYFSRLFKKQTGANFVDVLADMRMERAKALMGEGTLSIAEITLLCGYTNKKYFKQTFREKYGLSIEDYRRETHT